MVPGPLVGAGQRQHDHDGHDEEGHGQQQMHARGGNADQPVGEEPAGNQREDVESEVDRRDQAVEGRRPHDMQQRAPRVPQFDVGQVARQDEGDGKEAQQDDARGAALEEGGEDSREHHQSADAVQDPGGPPLADSQGEYAVMQVLLVRLHDMHGPPAVVHQGRQRRAQRSPPDGQDCVEERHAHDQKRHADGRQKSRFGACEQRHRGQNQTQEHAAAIPQKDRGGVEVVAQEAKTGAAERDQGERLAGLAPARQADGEPEGAEARQAGGQSIHAVD